jgi:hypothetical protein
VSDAHPLQATGASATYLLEQPQLPGVLMSASRDPDAKLTFVTAGSRTPGGERLVVKVATTEGAGAAVDAEGHMLVEMRRLGLGPLLSTVPRYVSSLAVDGRPVLVSTAVPGTPMSVAYHRFGHTARPTAVRRDFEAAFDWLGDFQTATSRAGSAADWPALVLEKVSRRWDGHPALPAALARLAVAHAGLAGQRPPATAVHGDYWFGNVLVTNGTVTGVVDWEAASSQGSPLADAARFVLSYGLYLDRHTRPGRRVLGHPGLRRHGFAPGIEHAVCGAGWFPDLVRETLRARLTGLGVDPTRWYDVALVGIGDVAASANDDEFGAGHLQLLATLPLRARRHRRTRR